MPGGGPALAVVLVCHDSADDLPGLFAALTPQLRDDDEVVVVDNVSQDGTAAAARRVAPGARVVEPGANLGFAGGCALGAGESGAPLLLFLNPDVVPAEGSIAALRACANERPGWGAWQALVTLPDERHVNTSGNVVHYVGIGWAGDLGRAVADVAPEPHDVGFASGAAFAVRREAWDAVGGFDPRFFMYSEDLDLSLRLKLAGWGVGVVPAARVAHEYEFAKGDYKWFYLERNRWWTVLGVYPAPVLALLAPALVAFEVGVLATAVRGGWVRAKLRSQLAVLRELPTILRRRRAVQATRVVPTAEFAGVLSTSLDSPYLESARRVPGLPAAQAAFFRVVLALLRAGAGRGRR
jgi:N-acetylglucosaminyl-diphospho-decaprenol L-rhamnosyltransferase